MKFKYIAYSKENKQLVGYINADTLEDARVELHKLGLSVINIEESTTEEAVRGDDKRTFEFEAADKTGKRLTGTIDAVDLFGAYLRLVDEYRFRLYWLVDASLSDIEKEQQKQTNLIDLETKYQQYKEEQIRKNTPLFKRIFGTTSLKNIQQNITVIQEQTEKVIAKAKEALELMGNNISPDARSEIKKKIEELLILKTSTNTERLQILSNDLLRLIKEQQNLLKKTITNDDDKDAMDKLNTLFQDIYSFSRFRDLKVDFGSIGKLLAKVQEALQTLKVEKKEKRSEELIEKEHQISELKQKIKTAYGNLKAQFSVYMRMWAGGKSKLLQEESKSEISKLWKTIKAHKEQIKFIEKEVVSLKKRRQQLRKRRFEMLGLEFLQFSTVLYEVKLFAHWLLLFYISYFLFCAYILRFRIDTLYDFANASIIVSPFLSYIIILLVLIYSGVSIHLRFFQRHPLFGILTGFLFAGAYLLILANF